MELHAGLCFVLLGIFLFSNIFRSNCKKLNGYEFPVYSTDVCPVNETEWNARSSAINCTTNNGYICIPNKELTQLLEFCYTQPFIWIQADICLYLVERISKVNAYNCSGFRSGCPSYAFVSSKLFEYPNCTSIQNGCFIAESSCKRKTEIEQLENVSISDGNVLANHPAKPTDHWNEWILYVVLLGVFVTIVYAFILLVILRRKDNPLCKRNLNTDDCIKEEIEPFVNKENKDTQNLIKKESIVDRTIFEQWQQDNNLFISTRACKKVEQLIKNQNLVIVAGHSGSGKSAIIQHIALKYRSQGWIVRPIYEVRELINDSLPITNKTLCVLNDPIGKESVDEISHDLWRQNDEKLKAVFKKVKVLMSCRKYILSDARIAGIFANKSYIVDINNNVLKLNDNEKETIFKKHSFVNKFSKEEFAAIMKIDAYFPLLCKLYFSNVTYQNDGLKFFKKPAFVLEEEIRNFRKASKEKYCALVLLVLFNNALCVNDFLQEETSKRKYKHALELCGMSENTAPYTICDILESMEGFFVKKIGDNFHFYHDFVMEITTYVFGSDYPKETIEYADVSFLRRRVKLEDCKDENDKFSIVLSDKYIANLGKRLFMEIFGEHLLDVVLNPCMRNEKVRNIIKEELDRNPEKYKMLLEKKVLQIEKDEQYKETKDLFLSKLSFLNLRNEISPISAMIVFCHTDLSLYCLKALTQLKTDIEDISLFSAVCCNGSLDLLDFFSNDHIKLYLKDTYACFHPIHLVSAFHNFEMMRQLIQFGVDVNLRQFGNNSNQDGCIPLIYAATANENNKEETSCETRRNETIKLLLRSGANVNQCKQNGTTPLHGACFYGLDRAVQLLLSNGANINICKIDGAGPLFIACQNGHNSTVQLLLSNGANINLCNINGGSPLHLACQNGHDSTVQLLLSNGADINLCMEKGTSPLYIACQNGHDSTVQLLLSNGANIDLCKINGYSPFYIACQNGHDSIVQLLLSNGANINSCMEGGAGPLYIACENGYESIVQLLLSNGANINSCMTDGTSPLFVACQNGHESIVQLLLSNGANINLCMEGGAGPLFVVCQNGYNSIVQLLLSNGANINSCMKDGAGPLYVACQNGHESIVQLLLSNGTNINVCKIDGAGPLYVACQNGYDSIVQLLLSNGANINVCKIDGAGLLYVACQSGYDSIVQLLLSNGANINLRKINGAGPLFVACQNGHESLVQLLLSNGASINLCMEGGAGPLYIACQNGYDSIVQLLLSSNGANINSCMTDGTSPLFVACQNGHESIVQLLLSNGANINSCMKDGAGPLYVACQNGHESIVQLLLSNGANINLCKINGAGPLHIACQNGHESLVQLLLSNGADFNKCLKNGASPLHIAIRRGHNTIVQFLLNAGAD